MYIPNLIPTQACLTVVLFLAGSMAEEKADQRGTLPSPKSKARPRQH
jgi:hypothetical protein